MSVPIPFRKSALPIWFTKALVMVAVVIGNLVLTALIYGFYGEPLNRETSYVVTIGWLVPWLILYQVHPKDSREWLWVISGMAFFVVADHLVWLLSFQFSRFEWLGGNAMGLLVVQACIAVAILGPSLFGFIHLLRQRGLWPTQEADPAEQV